MSNKFLQPALAVAADYDDDDDDNNRLQTTYSLCKLTARACTVRRS